MKKIGVYTILTLFATILMIGCGSNTKQDPLPPPPPPPPGSSYSFTNASTPLDINESDKDYDLSVQLIDGAFGLPGQTVKMAAFDSNYGIVDPAEVETDDGGWAHFSYHSPDNIDDISGQSITLQAVMEIYDDEDENRTVPVRSITQDFVLNFFFVPAPPAPPAPIPPIGNLYHLTNQSTPIVVDENNAIEFPSAYVVDANNTGIEGETVVVGMLDYKYGDFTFTSIETDETGKATFIYDGPDDITPLIGTSVDFNISYVSGGKTINSLPITIKFVQP